MPAKLTPLAKAEIANTVARRRALTKMIAKLTYGRSQLPNNRKLAKLHTVHYSAIRRAIYGDPYNV